MPPNGHHGDTIQLSDKGIAPLGLYIKALGIALDRSLVTLSVALDKDMGVSRVVIPVL